MRTGACLKFAVAFAVGVHAALAANPSTSKLSIQTYHQYTSGAAQIINAHPRVLKIIKNDTAMMDAARAFKASTPNGKVIMRPFTGWEPHFSLSDNAAGAADAWFAQVTQPQISGNGGIVDYVEGPNEGDSCPTFTNPTDAAWFSNFWLALTPKIVAAGFKPCLGSIAVGNPPGDSNNIRNTIAAFVPALRQAHAAGGIWGYHAYTYFYGTDPNGVELSYSLRYRQFYQLFADSYSDLSDMPIAFTECGAEGGGGGWKVHGDQVTFTNWLTWWDQQLQNDSYVLGSTLFVIGASEWGSYDIEDVAPWIAAHLQGQIIIPSAPYNLAATAGPAQVLLTWSGGYGSTGYKVKRATTSGGPYTQIATPATPAYTDTGLTNGITYYYVVTGNTSAGDSGSSPQVAATPGDGFAINCGGLTVGTFGGDAYYTNGSTWVTQESIDTSGVANAAPAAVYQSERAGYGNIPGFSYTFNGLYPNAPYTVRLHFAEIYFGGNNQRQFHVSINGSQVLSNFDIYNAAGARNRAVVRDFARNTDANGRFTIDFSQGSAAFPKISGIQIISTGPPPPPPAPVGLVATPGNTRVSLTWNPVSGATSYNLKRATINGGPYTSIATGLTTTSYNNIGLTNGTTYYYVVSAVNSSGEGSNSSQVPAIPALPPAPAGLSATASNTQVALSWNVVTTASSYNVKRSTTSGGPYATIATGVTTASYANTGLTNGTTYYYVVSAVDLSSEGANSTQVSATPFSRSDFNHDGDVDQEDFGFLQQCFTGAGMPQYDPACSQALLDNDADVDDADVTLFLACFSGPNIPSGLNCGQ